MVSVFYLCSYFLIFYFFFNDTATTEIYTLSLHDALPIKPWTPRTIEVPHWEPLLVSGNRIAATFADGGGGIAVTHFLDTATGHVIATTRPGPSARKAIAGPGEFLIGSQGYGAFSTARYDPSGTVTDRWPSHAMMLVDRHGHIR